jgi:hypothetical protein
MSDDFDRTVALIAAKTTQMEEALARGDIDRVIALTSEVSTLVALLGEQQAHPVEITAYEQSLHDKLKREVQE